MESQGEVFSLEVGQRLELLTGWGVCINHTTAVSSAGVSSGVEKNACKQSSPFPSPLRPLKNVPSQQVHQWVHPDRSC